MSQRQNRCKQPCCSVRTHLRKVAATKFKSTNEGVSISFTPCWIWTSLHFLSYKIDCVHRTSVLSTRRSISADEATCLRDVAQRFVASCVSALNVVTVTLISKNTVLPRLIDKSSLIRSVYERPQDGYLLRWLAPKHILLFTFGRRWRSQRLRSPWPAVFRQSYSDCCASAVVRKTRPRNTGH